MIDLEKLLISCLLVFETVTVMNIIVFLYVLRRMKKQDEEQKEKGTRKIRRHTTIKTSNYNNSYSKRGFEQFKNEKTGLYEPQKPHQGIELKKQKED